MLKQQLKKYFGFDSFLAGQEKVINRVLAGKSAAAIFPTGADDCLCYLGENSREGCGISESTGH